MAELLAIVWGVGNKKEDVLSMAKRTLKEYGEKTIINEQDPERLAEVADISLSKACQIVASFELGRRYNSDSNTKTAYIRNSRQAYQYLRPMGLVRKEQLRGLYLNSRYQIIQDEVISVGSLTASVVHPREVILPAIEHGAVALILAHNHPSGDLKPSDEDVKITEQLKEACELVGIDLLDHLIITNKGYKSLINESS